MRSKFIMFICFSLLVISCSNKDSDARIKALETKIENLDFHGKMWNFRISHRAEPLKSVVLPR